jgi:peptide/nickel transport system substrate-binding protein
VSYDFATSELVGDLATEWTASSDYKTYTFTLRTGVTWHDGKAFDSADVVWTLKDLIATGSSAYAYSYVANVDTVTAPDAKTVVVTLKKPDAVWVTSIANYYGPIILAEHIYQGTKAGENPANLKPIGTGPYTFVSHSAGDRIVMQSNPQYYGQVASIQNLVFRIIADRGTATAALEAGEIDYMAISPAFGDVKRLESTSGIKVTPTQSNIPMWTAINLENKILADVKVREAIGHAIDTAQMSTQVYQGRVKASTAQYLSYNWAYEAKALQPAHDVALANQMLDQAGHPRGSDGTRFTLRYHAWNASIFGGFELAQVMKEQLKAVGITLNVILNDYALFNDIVVKQRNFDLTGIGGLWGPDPQAMTTYLVTGGAQNVMKYSNPQVDELFANARLTADRDKQKEVYSQIQFLFAKDIPKLNLVEYTYFRPTRSNLSGLWWEDGSGTKHGVFQDMYNGVTRSSS